MDMNLGEALQQLSSIDRELYLYARRPFTLGSECVWAEPTTATQVADPQTNSMFDYFFEVSTGKEVLEGFVGSAFTNDEIAELLFYYALNDAYPEWADERCVPYVAQG
jgi:hypothetical protein